MCAGAPGSPFQGRGHDPPGALQRSAGGGPAALGGATGPAAGPSGAAAASHHGAAGGRKGKGNLGNERWGNSGQIGGKGGEHHRYLEHVRNMHAGKLLESMGSKDLIGSTLAGFGGSK